MHVSSFDLSKAMTFSKIFSKVKLSPTARLVLRCLVDFYNPQKGLVYPGQSTIADYTGAGLKTVNTAIKELRDQGLIVTSGSAGERLKYFFTRYFFDLLEMTQGNVKTAQEPYVKMTQHEQHEIKQINNKNKILNFQKAEGVNYISPEATRKQMNESLKRDNKSPYNDFETALKYINDLSGQMHIDLIQKQVEKVKNIWNI